MSDDFTESLSTIATRLATDGFAVQRDVQTSVYTFEILASRSGEVYGGTRIPSSKVVSVISATSPTPSGIGAYCSFLEKYALENIRSLAIGSRDLTMIPLMISSSMTDDLEQWMSNTAPSYSIMWDRTIFPVLVDMSTRSLTYYRQTPFRQRTAYPTLRKLLDKWFGFQDQADQ